MSGIVMFCPLVPGVEALAPTSSVITGGETAKVPEVAEVSAVAVKVNEDVPAPVILRSVKVATPPTAFTVSVPESVPGPLATAAVTALVAVATFTPPASRISITGCVVNTVPVAAPDGCVEIASCVAVCVSAIVFEVAEVSAVAEKLSVKLPAVPLICRLVKVATPFTALTVVVPTNVPVPLAIAAVTAFVAPATFVPLPSRISTTGCVPNTEPLLAFADGCVVIASCVAVCVTVTVLEVAEVRPVAVKLSVCAPDPLILRLVKVATPFTALTVVVPASVPVPDAIAAVTAFVAPATFVPLPSRISTTGCVANTVPLLALADGCVVIAN